MIRLIDLRCELPMPQYKMTYNIRQLNPTYFMASPWNTEMSGSLNVLQTVTDVSNSPACTSNANVSLADK